jgi:hypothetical protein
MAVAGQNIILRRTALYIPADDAVYEPTRFKIGIILYFRATKAIRGDRVGMASYRLVRAIRAGAAGDKDSKNYVELLLLPLFLLLGDSRS